MNIARIRNISFIVAGTILITAVMTPAAAAPEHPRQSPLIEPRAAKVAQKGRSLVFAIRTREPVNLQRLRRSPDFDDRRIPFLCFAVRPSGGGLERRLCVGGRNRPRDAIGFQRLAPSGAPVGARHTVPVRMKRPDRTTIVITVRPERLRMPPHRYHWRLLARQGGGWCRPGSRPRDCLKAIPVRGAVPLDVRAVVQVGCTTASSGVVRHGPRNHRQVALTFDDGPWSLTPAFLDVLRRKRVPATFYVVGQNVSARPATARRIVEEGHEIANHSWKHDLYPGYSDLSSTNATIRSITGFTPCTFRPPGGAINSNVISAAHSAGGMPTVLWDVDTLDWRLPGSGSIASTVINQSRPGSIVLMHDGGGPRGQTLDALPGMIDGLRNRGFSFTTVAELLGGSFRYAPAGG